MTVIVAENPPPYIRGLLKRWFIEPKPNVFVGTVNKRTREKTIEYLRYNTETDLNFLVITEDNSSQRFSIHYFGETKRKPVKKCGLYLIAESLQES
jgi:CRISPR-associated protein Cas2